MTIKFHENALKQFSRRLKFTNLASEPQKNSNLTFYVSWMYNQSDTLTSINYVSTLPFLSDTWLPFELLVY